MASPEGQYRTSENLEARIRLHSRFSTNPKGWMPWLLEQLEPLDGSQILEVGCGPGTFWQENSRRVLRQWELTLSDSSVEMVRQARRAVQMVLPKASFESATVSALPHEDGRFDWVVANHMLYHAPNQDQALAEIRRVLRPGGHLFASTIGGDSLAELRELVRESTSRRDFWASKPSDPFTLENAPAQLQVHFTEVDTRRYEDALAVTEVEPVLGYLGSLILDVPFSEGELRQVGAALEGRLRDGRPFHVSKSAGALICKR